MEYIILALAIVAIVAVIVAAACYAGMKSAKVNVTDLTAQLAAQKIEQAQLSATANDEVARRERVIVDLKAELSQMEKDLAANKDPAAVHSRLKQLLSP